MKRIHFKLLDLARAFGRGLGGGVTRPALWRCLCAEQLKYVGFPLRRVDFALRDRHEPRQVEPVAIGQTAFKAHQLDVHDCHFAPITNCANLDLHVAGGC